MDHRAMQMIIWEKYGDEHQKAYNKMMADSYRPEGADNGEYVRVLLKEQAMREELENAT